MLTEEKSNSVFKIQVKTKDGKLKFLDTKFNSKSAAIKELKDILIGMNNGDKCEDITHLLVIELLNDSQTKNKDQVFN